MNKELAQNRECPNCLFPYYVAPLTSLPSCPFCGFEFTEEKDWQYWDQSLPGYSDAELKQFAVDATNFLIQEEYQKRGWNMYSIGWESEEHGETSWDYDVDWSGDCGVNFTNTQVQINYDIHSLRAKRHCGDTVAHESAHASPRVAMGQINSKYLYPIKDKEQREKKGYWGYTLNYWAGHHYLWQKEHHEFRSKIRTRFPKYWGE